MTEARVGLWRPAASAACRRALAALRLLMCGGRGVVMGMTATLLMLLLKSTAAVAVRAAFMSMVLVDRLAEQRADRVL